MRVFSTIIAFVISVFANAYDLQYGDYYFNRLNLTKTENIGGVTTYHYNVEATSREGGYSSFKQTYSGAICPPGTFNVTEIEEGKTITYVYTLTKIGDMAFANNVEATELTIPSTVIEISGMGLLPNMSLKKVTCQTITPPSHAGSYLLCVEDVTSSATLYVPAGTKNAYQTAAGWKDFLNILEQSPSIGNHEYVDLGLPSGKLWSTTNYGTNSATGYGTYVDWSSTDVVTAAWGEYWGTPTRSEWNEIVDYCTWSWDSSKKGYTVTGPNGNTLFLPAAGFKIMGYSQSVGSGIYYWSSTASSESGFSFMLSGNSSSVSAYSTYNTSIMQAPIRPIVRGEASPLNSVWDDEVRSIGIYDINGHQLTEKQRGINILKMSDGTCRKVLVK